jgi:hypothetical protein
MDIEHGHAPKACSIGMLNDMQMDIHDGEASLHAARTCSVDMQHGYGHGASKWTYSIEMDMQHRQGHATSTGACNIDMSMQHAHGHAQLIWTCSMDMDVQHGHGNGAGHGHGHGQPQTRTTYVHITPPPATNSVTFFDFSSQRTAITKTKLIQAPPPQIYPGA